MQFSTVQEFFAMGGYGLYVWLAYGICALSLGGLILATRWRRKALLGEVKRALARKERIEQSRRRKAA